MRRPIMLVWLLAVLPTTAFSSDVTNPVPAFIDDIFLVNSNGVEVTGEAKTEFFQRQSKFGVHFTGIGVALAQTNGEFVIKMAFQGSPAAKAGLESGDIITAIDHQSIDGLALSNVVARIGGEAGTAVELSISRQSRAQPFDVKVTREEMRIHSEYREGTAQKPKNSVEPTPTR